MMSIDYLSQMSPQLFIEQMTYLPFRDVISICSSNRKLNSYCNDPKYKNIWKSLIDNTFGGVFDYEDDIKKIWEKHNYPLSTYNYLVYTKLVNLLDPITQLIIYYKQNDMESFNNERFDDKERFLAFFLLNNKQKAKKYLPDELYQPLIDLMEGEKLSQDMLDEMLLEFIRYRNVLGVSLMLKNGADIEKNITGFKGYPLFKATQIGDLKMVKFLINSGANIGSVAIEGAIEEGHLNVLDYLIKKGATIDETTLETAIIWGGKIEVLEYLLNDTDFGNNVDENILNNSLLANSYYKTLNGSEIVKLLLRKGADVNYNNGLPLLYAIGHHNIDIVKSLLENGANVNINNEAPLLRAIEAGDVNIVKLLLQNGANINAIDRDILWESVDERNMDMIIYLRDILG